MASVELTRTTRKMGIVRAHFMPLSGSEEVLEVQLSMWVSGVSIYLGARDPVFVTLMAHLLLWERPPVFFAESHFGR